jgi:hypothetical protein
MTATPDTVATSERKDKPERAAEQKLADHSADRRDAHSVAEMSAVRTQELRVVDLSTKD